ncbi:MAG: adenylyltransferase/cytidyltransferase family protein [Clostridia bacterium]|nr:adenylyltransferase/cytidyltransferase family protein [Clostridia bacterium]
MDTVQKPYRTGVLTGRFQMIHLGHIDMIEKAREICEEIIILVGSAQEAGTEKNPFSYEERRDMLKAVFPEKNVRVFPLPDAGLGNNALWGEHILNKVKEYTGALPDLMITGKEERREGWFSGPNGTNTAELAVPKSIPLSATQMREWLIRGEEEKWSGATSPVLRERYPALRAAVLASIGKKQTDSI